MYLEVECLVTVEDECESSELITKGLHRLCLAGTSRTCREKYVSYRLRSQV